MTRKELLTAKDNEIIYDYINTARLHAVNQNMGGGIKALSQHLKDLDKEMLRRGLLTQEQIDWLNS